MYINTCFLHKLIDFLHARVEEAEEHHDFLLAILREGHLEVLHIQKLYEKIHSNPFIMALLSVLP